MYPGSPSKPSRPIIEVKPHSTLDDVYGILVGVLFVVIGIVLLHAAGLLTGGVAGIALLTSYSTGLSVGTLFMMINVPFFLFGYFFMGARFTIKSLAGSAMIMGLLKIMPFVLVIDRVHPAVAALGGGTFCGMGILALARHGAGVGGTGIVTLWLQKQYNINAGRVMTAPQLLRAVWGPGHAESGHYLRIYMGHLRHKLEPDPAQPRHLLTETGVGYRLWLG